MLRRRAFGEAFDPEGVGPAVAEDGWAYLVGDGAGEEEDEAAGRREDVGRRAVDAEVVVLEVHAEFAAVGLGPVRVEIEEAGEEAAAEEAAEETEKAMVEEADEDAEYARMMREEPEEEAIAFSAEDAWEAADLWGAPAGAEEFDGTFEEDDEIAAMANEMISSAATVMSQSSRANWMPP